MNESTARAVGQSAGSPAHHEATATGSVPAFAGSVRLERRWPLEPLAAFVGVRLDLDGSASTHGAYDEASVEPLQGAPALAEVVGVSLRTVRRWSASGLTSEAADRAATAAGTLPELLWRGWLDDVDERPHRWCTCPSPVPSRRRCDRCDGLLHPVRHGPVLRRARQGSLLDEGAA